MTNMFIPFDEKNLVYSRFVDRPNRFIIRCKLEETKDIVEAHLADSGRLKELLIQDKKILLRFVDHPNRKTKYSAVAVEQQNGQGWVSINSTLPNDLARLAIDNELFPSLKGWKYVRSEYTKGNSRWDILLQNENKRMVIEVKGVTLTSDDGIGYFPDAVTKRGTKHIKELTHITQETGWESGIIFVAQRDDIIELRTAKHIDPAFSKALIDAKKAGVHIFGIRCKVSPKGISVLDEIKITI